MAYGTCIYRGCLQYPPQLRIILRIDNKQGRGDSKSLVLEFNLCLVSPTVVHHAEQRSEYEA